MVDISYQSKIVSFAFLLSLTLHGCNPPSTRNEHEHHHGEEQAEDLEHGPHQGRMLTDGNFQLELKIFETGVPPQYRIFAFQDGHPISPKDYTVQVTLKRLGGRVDELTFHAVGEFLKSDQKVEEPHSFDVEVNAEHEGKKHSWEFDSYEGRTTIPDEVAQKSGIRTETASSREMKTVLRTRGKILPSEHKIAHIIPRFSGIVREGKKHIGDKVEKGEVLAIVESNESLQPFEVRSQISGTVINGHLIVGEFIPENQWVYIVADLSEVWADFFVPLRERMYVKNGQKVFIRSADETENIEGRVSYVAPYADEKTQSQLLRVVVPNEKGELLPGMFVIGDVVVGESNAAVAIRKNSIQTFRDWQVVFAKVGDIYEIRPLTLGRTDGEWIEVLQGIIPGDEYVIENPFLLKADILKSGASHDH